MSRTGGAGGVTESGTKSHFFLLFFIAPLRKQEKNRSRNWNKIRSMSRNRNKSKGMSKNRNKIRSMSRNRKKSRSLSRNRNKKQGGYRPMTGN